MRTIVCDVLTLYTFALIIRALLSWIPLRPDSGLIPVVRVLDTVIDPVIQPLRRVIPPIGMFDVSFLVLFFIVEIIHSSVCGAALF